MMTVTKPSPMGLVARRCEADTDLVALEEVICRAHQSPHVVTAAQHPTVPALRSEVPGRLLDRRPRMTNRTAGIHRGESGIDSGAHRYDDGRGRLAGVMRGSAVVGLLTVVVLLWAHPVWAQERQLAWEADDCAFTIVLIPTSQDTIQPHIPDGFTPTVPEKAASLLPPDPRLEAVFGYEVFRCATQTIGDHRADDVAYASLWTFVEPPDDLADPDFPLAFFKWTTMTPDAAQRSELEALDVRVVDGEADLAGLAVTSAGAAYDVTFTLGSDQITYRTSGLSNNPTTFEGRFIEYSPLDGRAGFARWRTDFAADVAFGGTAVARWDQDAFATRVLGTTEAQAWVLAGSGLIFSDGSITVPQPRGAPGDPGDDRAQPGRDSAPDRGEGSLPATGGGAGWLGLIAVASALLATVARGRIDRRWFRDQRLQGTTDDPSSLVVQGATERRL